MGKFLVILVCCLFICSLVEASYIKKTELFVSISSSYNSITVYTDINSNVFASEKERTRRC